jgi:hypothetical protein
MAEFDCFPQTVGPPCAYYEINDGENTWRYPYRSFGWMSDDEAKVVARLRDFVGALKLAQVEEIVWRQYPEIRQDDGKWLFYCRMHVLPLSNAGHEFEKREGEMFPEAY